MQADTALHTYARAWSLRRYYSKYRSAFIWQIPLCNPPSSSFSCFASMFYASLLLLFLADREPGTIFAVVSLKYVGQIPIVRSLSHSTSLFLVIALQKAEEERRKRSQQQGLHLPVLATIAAVALCPPP